jgi:hypothetical protein
MMTGYPSSVPIQLERPQYNSAQATQVSVVDAYHRDRLESSLSYTSTQALDGFDQELGSNEHLSGIGPAGPYPAISMNHADAAKYSSTMAVSYDDAPHLATVSVHLLIFMSPSFMVALSKRPGGYQGIQNQRQLDVHLTPGMTHCIPFSPSPPRREYYASAFPVSVLPPPPLFFFFLAHTCSLSYCTSDYRRFQMTVSPVRYLSLIM